MSGSDGAPNQPHPPYPDLSLGVSEPSNAASVMPVLKSALRKNRKTCPAGPLRKLSTDMAARGMLGMLGALDTIGSASLRADASLASTSSLKSDSLDCVESAKQQSRSRLEAMQTIAVAPQRRNSATNLSRVQSRHSDKSSRNKSSQVSSAWRSRRIAEMTERQYWVYSKIVSAKWFERSVLLVILLNCIILAMANPLLEPDDWRMKLTRVGSSSCN